MEIVKDFCELTASLLVIVLTSVSRILSNEFDLDISLEGSDFGVLVKGLPTSSTDVLIEVCGVFDIERLRV